MGVPIRRAFLTLEEWYALPEDNSAHYELQEGVLIVAPKRGLVHQTALFDVARRIHEQLPPGVRVAPSAEVVVRAEDPATVRVPDLVITTASPKKKLLAAPDVVLAVEIISPGSRNVDLHLKPFEYAEACIPHYWVVDLDSPSPSVMVFELGDGVVKGRRSVTGELVVTEPFPVTIDPARLAD